MLSDVQVYRQVPQNNAIYFERNEISLYKLLKMFDSIISKSNNDIGQMDLIEMHNATRP